MAAAAYEAWFFDLGGTLVEIEKDEIALGSDGKVVPLPGALEALEQLRGEKVFVVSNQASVATGALPALQAYDYIAQLNALCGDIIQDFRFAMHPAEANHPWRKPGSGMVEDLALVYRLDLSRCVLVGDSDNDRRCAQSAGVGTFLWIDAFVNGQES